MALTPDDRRELIEAMTMAVTASIGPAGDYKRAVMAATVDGLIDARKRLILAGFPDWQVSAILMSMIGAPTHTQFAVVNEEEPHGPTPD